MLVHTIKNRSVMHIYNYNFTCFRGHFDSKLRGMENDGWEGVDMTRLESPRHVKGKYMPV